MRIEQFVRALLPNYEKKKVVEELQSLASELAEVTLPAYQRANDVFKNSNEFRSEAVIAFDKECRARLSHFKGTHISIIHRSLKLAQANSMVVLTAISNNPSNQIAREAMSYILANQLQYVEVMTFASEFARRWLLHLFTLETTRFQDESDLKDEQGILRAQKYIDEKKESFFQSLRIVARTPEDIDKTFKEIPDVVVDPDKYQSAQLVMGSSKLDPLKFGFIPVKLNPLYYIRLAYTEWQANRYHLLKEEARQLELRLLLLKEQRSGQPSDAKLEKQIDYSNERLDKMRYKLHRMENPNE